MVLKLKRPVVIRTSLDTYDFMRAVINGEDILEENIHFDMAKEHFWAIALDRVDKTINFELVALGSDCQTVVNPKEVYGIPFYKRAAGVILVHNHPNGTLYASEPDRDLTDRLIQAGRIIEIPVIDHVIITDHSYYSFKDTGLLYALEQSIKYVPHYELEKRFHKQMDDEIRKIKKQEQKKINGSFEKGKMEGVEMGLQKKSIEVAQRMLSRNYPIEEITGLTNLSKEEIKLLGK